MNFPILPEEFFPKHYFDVLLVLFEEVSEVEESLLDSISQNAYSLGLVRTYSPEDTLRCKKYIVAEVVSAHALRVGN